MKQLRVYFLLYFIVTIADLLLIYFNQPQLRWFTKPLLMPLLFFVVWNNRNTIPLYKWMLAGLALSWAGDILLQMKGMFIPGLISLLHQLFFATGQKQKRVAAAATAYWLIGAYLHCNFSVAALPFFRYFKSSGYGVCHHYWHHAAHEHQYTAKSKQYSSFTFL
jgi:uncharacterized membrane protein YhhN